MKYGKFKLKRCEGCTYYEKIGRLHFCVNSKYNKKHNLKILCAIPLICFRKKVKK